MIREFRRQIVRMFRRALLFGAKFVSDVHNTEHENNNYHRVNQQTFANEVHQPRQSQQLSLPLREKHKTRARSADYASALLWEHCSILCISYL